MDTAEKAAICLTTMSANIGRVTYLGTVPIHSEVISVLAEKDIPGMVIRVPILMNAQILHWPPNVWKTPSVAIYPPTLSASAVKALRAMVKWNVEVREVL